ncbi:hypothetical protein QJQ45_024896 [Haematococcus lacustris]|nr:hypothetical protein QJQ45_024896 [Haematococcus lacustris]
MQDDHRSPETAGTLGLLAHHISRLPGGMSNVSLVVGHSSPFQRQVMGRTIRQLPFRGITSTAPFTSQRRVDPSLAAIPLHAVSGLHGQTALKTTMQGHIVRTTGKGQPTLDHTSDDPELAAEEVSAWLQQCHAPALDGVQFEMTKTYTQKSYQCHPANYTFAVSASNVAAMLAAHEQNPYITDVATHTAVTSGRMRCSLEEVGPGTYPQLTTAYIQLTNLQGGDELGLPHRSLTHPPTLLPSLRHATHLAVGALVLAVAGPPPTEPEGVPRYAETLTTSPLWRVMKALDVGAVTADPQRRQNCYVVHSDTDHLQQLLDRHHRISVRLGNTFALTLTSTNPPQPPPYCIAVSSPSSIAAVDERSTAKYADLLSILVQLQVRASILHQHTQPPQHLDTIRHLNVKACHNHACHGIATRSSSPQTHTLRNPCLHRNPHATAARHALRTTSNQPTKTLNTHHAHTMSQAQHSDPGPLLALLVGASAEHEQWKERIRTETTRPLTFTNLQGDLLTLELTGNTLASLVVTRSDPLTQQVTRESLEAAAVQCAALAFCATDGTPLYSCSKGQVSKEMLIQVGSSPDMVNLLAAAHFMGDDLKVGGEVIKVGLPYRYLTGKGDQVVWIDKLSNKGLDYQSGRVVSSEEAAAANLSKTSLGSITNQDGFVFRCIASIADGSSMAEIAGANATRTMQAKATTAMASARVDPVGPSSYAPQVRRANTHLGPTPMRTAAAPRRGWAAESCQNATQIRVLPPRAEGARPTPHGPPPSGRPATQGPLPPGRPTQQPRPQPASRGPSPISSGGRHSRNPSRGSSGSSIGAFDELAIEAGYMNMNRAPSDPAVDAPTPAAQGGGASTAMRGEAAAAAVALGDGSLRLQETGPGNNRDTDAMEGDTSLIPTGEEAGVGAGQEYPPLSNNPAYMPGTAGGRVWGAPLARKAAADTRDPQAAPYSAERETQRPRRGLERPASSRNLGQQLSEATGGSLYGGGLPLEDASMEDPAETRGDGTAGSS